MKIFLFWKLPYWKCGIVSNIFVLYITLVPTSIAHNIVENMYNNVVTTKNCMCTHVHTSFAEYYNLQNSNFSFNFFPLYIVRFRPVSS